MVATRDLSLCPMKVLSQKVVCHKIFFSISVPPPPDSGAGRAAATVVATAAAAALAAREQWPTSPPLLAPCVLRMGHGSSWSWRRGRVFRLPVAVGGRRVVAGGRVCRTRVCRALLHTMLKNGFDFFTAHTYLNAQRGQHRSRSTKRHLSNTSAQRSAHLRSPRGRHTATIR